MIPRLGLWISRIFRQCAPDPFVIAILLTFLVAVVGVVMIVANAEHGREEIAARSSQLFAAWSTGFWDLLKFAMQMSLVLVTGHALASSGPVARILGHLAALPKTGPGAAALVCVVASLAGLVNWGLGLIVGAVLARDVGRSLAARGVRAHYPLQAAAGYMGLLVFHGGLSGSAPLTMSTVGGVKSVMPNSPMAQAGGTIGLDHTLGSTLNLLVTGGMVLWLPAVFWLLHPRDQSAAAAVPMARNLTGDADAKTGGSSMGVGGSSAGAPDAGDLPGRVPDWLERSKWISTSFGALLLAAVAVYWRQHGWARIGIDQVNFLMFGLGLIMHGSVRSYAAAAEDAARGAAGVIVQFPIYAGIMALMGASGLTRMLAEGLTGAATPATLPLLTFLAATLVGLFVPSGGAQWSIQGPIALATAGTLGVDDGRVLMAVAYGDEVANMLQPFWALPLLAITGVKAREIVGYTAIVMILAMAWTGLCLLLV